MSLPRNPQPRRAVMRSLAGFFVGWGLGLVLVSMSAFAFAPAADTIIRNQAVVTFYTQAATQAQTQYSNEVEVRVAKVEALTLTAPQTVRSPPGRSVILPHVLTNTGNTASTYQFTSALESGCFALSNLRLIHDRNNNGVVDAGEPELALNASTGAALDALPAGASVSLLLLGDVPATVQAPAQCSLTLNASTTLQQVTASVQDSITVAQGASFSSSKSSDANGPIVAGQTVRFDIRYTNVGTAAASPASHMTNPRAVALVSNTSDPAAQRHALMIDGVAANKVLLRDVIPVGMSFVPGSLSSTHSGAQLLYRRAGVDGPFQYQTTDQNNVVEVAVALDSLAANASIALSFSAKVAADFDGTVQNTAELFSNDQRETAAGAAQDAATPVPTNTVQLNTSLVPGPDLVVKKFANGNFVVGGINSFTIQVDNVGTGATTAPIVVTNTLPAGMTLASVSGAGWTCSVSGQVVTCTYAYLPGATTAGPSRASPIELRVQIDPALVAGGGHIVLNSPVRVSGGGEANSRTHNNTAEAAVKLMANSVIQGIVWHDITRDRQPQDYEPRLAGWEVDLALYSPPLAGGNGTDCPEPRAAAGAKPSLNQYPYSAPCFMPVKRAVTDSAGSYTMTEVLPRGGYTLLFRTPAGYQVGHPVNGHQPGLAANTAVEGGQISDGMVDPELGVLQNITIASGVNYVQQSLPVDYGGVVYDAITRKPVAGATVRIVGPAGFNPMLHLVGGETNVAQLTAADGMYVFILATDAPSGRYRVEVTPPSIYRFPSSMIPPVKQALAVQPSIGLFQIVQAQGLAPQSNQATQYYLAFDFATGAQKVVNNHIPLDPPTDTLPWVVQKSVDKTVVEAVDFVQYRITLNNETGIARSDVTVIDQPATGFRYVPGSARLHLPGGSSVPITPQLPTNDSSDPAGRMQFVLKLPIAGSSVTQIAPKESFSISYRMEVQVTALQGHGINTAWASSNLPTPTLPSNRASAKVQVRPGVFSNEGYVLGTVFLDCSKDGVQQTGEAGIPGVRLYMEDGRFVETDKEGRFSLYGLSPTTHVLKIDDTTVPAGAVWGRTSGRNSDVGWVGSERKGQADSQFLDIKNGEMQTALFALQSCDAATQQQVQQRRAAARPVTSGNSAASTPNTGSGELANRTETPARFAVASTTAATATASSSDERLSKPAAGVLDPKTGQIKTDMALPSSAAPAPSAKDSASGAAGAVGAIAPDFSNVVQPLESYLDDAVNPELSILNLQDAQVLPFAQTNVQIKGRLGASLQLRVNEQLISDSRIGKRSDVSSKQVAAVEYIAVPLQAGSNTIAVAEVDSFGNVRKQKQVRVVAPGKLAQIAVKVLSPELVADGKTPVPVDIRLLDEHGTPVTTRTQIIVKTDVGQWQPEAGMTQTAEGMEWMVQGGHTQLSLIPPLSPAEGEMLVRSNQVQSKTKLRFTPFLRPLMAVGVLDGVFDLSRVNLAHLEAARKSDGFDETLQALAGQNSQSGQSRSGARAAFFLKGKILGKYLLTAAYDSQKQSEGRLFRDISPDAYYPIYGDDSVKGFEAQSSGRLYVRVDKGSSYVLYGDYSTAGDSVRQLTQVSRGLHGAKVHIEEDVPWTDGAAKFTANAYAAKGTQKQMLETLRANGTTGPFVLSGKGLLENSEQVSVVVYDQNQPQLLLPRAASARTLIRHVDYTIEPVSGAVRLRKPLASTDEDGNWVFLQVRYEVEQNGEDFWVRGMDAQIDVQDKLKVGVMAMQNQDPARPEQVQGIYAQAKPIQGLTVIAEHVQAKVSPGNGVQANAPTVAEGARQGSANRVEARYESGPVTVRGQWQKADAQFDASQSSISKGREEAVLEASARVASSTTVKADVRISKDHIAQTEQRQQSVALTQQLGAGVSVEAGVKRLETITEASTSSAASREAGNTARVKLSAVMPGLSQLSGFVEYERDVQQSQKESLTLGSEYRDSWGRVYARQELLAQEASSSVTADNQRRSQIGAEVKIAENTSLYSEFRQSVESTATPASLVYGLRQQLQLQRWTFTGQYERSRNLGANAVEAGGSTAPDNTAVSLAAAYVGENDSRFAARIERRFGAQEDALNLALAASYRLDSDFALLWRSRLERRDSASPTGTDQTQQRHQLGVVYRPLEDNTVQVLGSIERIAERNISRADAQAAVSRAAWMLSVHAVWQPVPQLELTGRVAAKWVTMSADQLSSKAQGRLVLVRARYDLAPRWDIGLQGFVLAGSSGALQRGYGLELGYKLSEDIWLSLGYNHLGFVENDLAGAEQTRKGVYLRLRVKF